ncbi:MAG: dTMP kinase [Candidatus Terraquivivens tikiterensis]|uniref:Probable thymidylate kinase n=1 Tax=Candidatus Terraquivivens tikiterensis TaxID=1980982 RepID=A0A2R7Y0X4_9ARCH|nr:MAG: dTMP kinase [Candidatus Terraquivivens tikiterensis]
MQRGILVAVEGIDGAGKTTQSKALVRLLRKNGYDAIYTSEPTSVGVGKLLRRPGLGKVPPALEALLFAADRMEHVRRVIEPGLRKGYVIVSDRYVHSSIAYQGAMLGDAEWVRTVNRFAPKPDVAFLLDVEPRLALSRIRRPRSRFERLELLEAVRKIYLEMAGAGELILLDGTKPPGQVTEELLARLRPFLPSPKSNCTQKLGP